MYRHILPDNVYHTIFFEIYVVYITKIKFFKTNLSEHNVNKDIT